jgi:cell wall-associated NlpC family hydrolase
VERLPHGRHHRRDARSAGPSRAGQAGGSRRGRLGSRTRLTIVTGTIALIGVLTPAGVAGASTARPSSGTPSLKVAEAEVNKLTSEIDSMGQQYDALRIQLSQARREAAVARQTARRDHKLMASGQAAVGRLAASGYMSGTMNPTLQMLQSSNPQQFLDQASIMLQLEQESGDKLDAVSTAELAAQRASLTAQQQETQASQLSAAMATKVDAIKAKEAELNKGIYAQALAIYQHTGTYPAVTVTGSSVEVQALQQALTRVGDEYVWGAAGPTTFDCSGLVVWAYAQLGISLPHYTGDLWNSGEHIPRDELQVGDLVFFFAGLDHVGIYVGNGMFLDAPSTGQEVQIQPMMWDVYDGAVRIA